MNLLRAMASLVGDKLCANIVHSTHIQAKKESDKIALETEKRTHRQLEHVHIMLNYTTDWIG